MNAPIQQQPHDAAAEYGVIGSMIAGGAAVIEEMRALLSMEAFYLPACAMMFGAICNLQASGVPTDLITLTAELRNAEMLDTLRGEIDEGQNPYEGAAFVTRLFNYTPTAVNVGFYADIVREKFMLRQMIAVCTTAARRCYEDQDEAAGVLDELQSEVIEIGQLTKSIESLKPIGDTVPEAIEQLEATYRNRGHPMGISSGFVDVDRMTGGWLPAKTYVIAARPAMGKTSLALEFGEYAAIDAAEKNVPVAVFSLEMTTIELAEVILCRRAGIDLKKLRTGFFSQEQRAALKRQAAAVAASKIFIDDKAGLSIFEYRARARRAVMKHGCRLIIIDYVQLMKSTSKRAQGNRELEISEIMQGIRTTAKELKVPTIVLAQLNRDAEKRSVDGVPQLSDLRESGSIEQEADLVGLLYRPSYYAKSDERMYQMATKRQMDVQDFKQLAELIIAKQRRGPVGTVPLRFVKELAHFVSEDPDRPLYSNRDDQRQRPPEQEEL